MLSRGLLSTVALCLVIVVTGCSSPPLATTKAAETGADLRPLSQVKPLAEPQTHVGPTTARLAQADITGTKPAVQHLPATVTDHQGTQVTVTDTSRILAFDMSGTLAATVFGLGLGGNVVGRDVSTGFPAARDLPLVTMNGHRLNAEAILALRPTVVITDTTLGPWDAVLQLRASGVPVVVVDSKRSMDNVGDIVRQVAAALGVPEAGESLAVRLAADVDAKKAEIAKLAPADPSRKLRVVFLYMRGQAGVYHLFGKGSGADSLIRGLGAIDVATEAGIEGMRPVNPEALAKTAPDVILMMTKGLESVGGVGGALQVPGVAQTPAGQHRRIVDMADSQILSFGPLTAGVLDALARALYAPDDAG
ncbi:iron complex transport system substrate-binding protein [Amycolatopsis lurida]|uniref:heme/hemin ABC transporter substrate-binding protein n=1 Tax=Amycolatopsis lurida TaxID=31959 RepID=UPI00055154A4|nr:ABC transporter substrate-binding protein [Amycolatopsis lurida]SED95386.1 iron complex transport system substrate-binding protein [Amycolatopsis lurida]